MMIKTQAFNIIRKSILTYKRHLFNLPKIGETGLKYTDISVWDQNSQMITRNQNDNNNKIRENILHQLINDSIPHSYFIYSRRWRNLRDRLGLVIDELFMYFTDNDYYDKISSNLKGGRNNYNDLTLTYYTNNNAISVKVEFKYGVSKISQCPQFVSPSKPSKYLSNNFESDYYEKVLPKLCEKAGISLPVLEDYLKQIHSDKPKCVLDLQEQYYKGAKKSSKYTGKTEDIDFYHHCKNLSKGHIEKFIEATELNIAELSAYLKRTQSEKYYILYCNNRFHLEVMDPSNYQIISVKKEPELSRYQCKTKMGQTLNILLRWKNGNGIAYPAFQIKCNK